MLPPTISYRRHDFAAITRVLTDLHAGRNSRVAQFGEFSLNFRTMELWRANQPVELTLQEFKVLKFFVTRPRVVISRQKLVRSVWPKRKRASYRTVDNCIAKLRRKIERNRDSPALIRTVHGLGYKFVPPKQLDSLGSVSLSEDAEGESE